MKYCIYDTITDAYLCVNKRWDSYDMDGLGTSEPLSFTSIKEARKMIKALEKEFLRHDPSSQIEFAIIRFEEKPYYRFWNGP